MYSGVFCSPSLSPLGAITECVWGQTESLKKKKKERRRRKILDPQTLLGFQCCCQATILYFKSNLCFFISSSETGYRRKSAFRRWIKKKKKKKNPPGCHFSGCGKDALRHHRPKKDTICIQTTCWLLVKGVTFLSADWWTHTHTDSYLDTSWWVLWPWSERAAKETRGNERLGSVHLRAESNKQH